MLLVLFYPYLLILSDDQGRTPLYFASLRGNTAAAIILLKRGAQINIAKDTEGNTKPNTFLVSFNVSGEH